MLEPTFAVEVQNDHDFPASAEALTGAALTVLNAHEVEPGTAMTIVLESDAAVAALNAQFRGVNAPTDVLSFPMDAPPMPGEPPYLGDVIIGYAYAAAQAESEGFTVADGLLLLVVHGTLHLLGYDHDTPENRAEMWAAQADALTSLGVPLSIVPRLEERD